MGDVHPLGLGLWRARFATENRPRRGRGNAPLVDAVLARRVFLNLFVARSQVLIFRMEIITINGATKPGFSITRTLHD